jgi:cytochrome c peroxidase
LLVIVLCGGSVAAQEISDDESAGNPGDPTGLLLSESDAAVIEGLRIFTQETFGGNGRVCATCHPPTNNFTIDPALIRTLPSNDPLFVSESDLNLRGLEHPRLLRRFGLVRVNIDGFNNSPVSRAVPHLLGLSQTISKGATPLQRTHLLGWSGDGSPGDGSLRNFAAGAIAQHLPRTLQRRGCATADFDPAVCDFRLPTDGELDALEQFQLFLGRQSEINIQPLSTRPNEIVFLDPFVEQGKELFHSVRGGQNFSCNSCHANAGANDRAGNGRLFPVGAERHPNMPACRLPGGNAPGDGGFSGQPVSIESGQVICRTFEDYNVVFRGKGQFNTPSIIESADTPPFFHNNIVTTIEEAVSFYNTEVFARSTAGAGIPFNFLDIEVRKIAALLRVLNALNNMDNGDRFDQLAQRAAGSSPQASTTAVQIAAAETQDAIQVLTTGPVPLYQNTSVISLLRRALAAERQALGTWDPGLLDRAIRLKEDARNQMIQIRP